MYNKIIELPISYYSEKEKEISWHVCLGCKRSAKLLFSILELVIKEPLTIIFALGTMFIISTKLTLFDFHANFRMDHFEISQELRAKSLEAQKESGQLISIVDETLGA
jgi:subfamily B ATP-binding cassette protein MsbA